MPRRVDSSRRGAQVNVLKKVRTSQGWQLCPVVREFNGRLRDRVRVGGRIELHTEGVYYLEWREGGRRLRAAIPNPAEVLERARLKSLELEARQTGVSLDALRPRVHAESLTPAPRARCYPEISIRTLQEWLGHSDLASTMVYLKYVGRQGVHEIIDKSAMAELAAAAFRSGQCSVSSSAD